MNKNELSNFEKKKIQKRLSGLLEDAKGSFNKRFDEIKNFITHGKSDTDYECISEQMVFDFFKDDFCEYVIITMKEEEKEISENSILNFLTAEVVEKAILGKPMIDAFSNAIQLLPNSTAFQKARHGSKIFLINKTFLGIEYPKK